MAHYVSFGIKTQIDLRKPSEVADQGRGPLETMGARYVSLPVIPENGSDRLAQLVGDTGISGKRYLGYLEFEPETWHTMFDIFADPHQHAIVLHCTAGKDRTGVSTAFLLATLGVDRNIIEADYLLTNLDVERQVNFIETNVGFPEGMDRDRMTHAAGVPETAMHDFLNGLEDRWGGTVEFLKHIGINDATLDHVRQNFLE